MPIEDITIRIRKDAEAEKERILEEARMEAHRIRNGYQSELDARVTELKVRAGKERDRALKLHLLFEKRPSEREQV